jgi:hypothetical protein
MAKQILDEYIDRSAIKSDTEFFLTEAKKVAAALQDLTGKGLTAESAKSFKSIVDGLRDVQKAQEALNKTLLQGDKLSRDQIKTATELAKQKAAAAKATENETRAEQAKLKVQGETVRNQKLLAQYEAQLAKEQEKLAKQQEKANKELDKANNAYSQLSKRYNEAANASKRRGAELLIEAQGNSKLYTELLKTDKAYITATADAVKYYQQLDLLENTVGQAQRRVGQYERAQFSLNQVLREAPAFANSLQTGFMAISNNLPMLVDEFKKLKESTGSSYQAFKVLATGLFSFQTALLVGITALTVYGKEIGEWFSSLGEGADKYDAVIQAQKEMNSISVESAKTFSKEKVELTALLAVAQDETKSKLERSAAIKKINDQMPDHLGNITLENVKTAEGIKIINSYIETLGKKALAQAYISKIQTLYVKLIDAENSSVQDNITLWDQFVSRVKNPSVTGISPAQIAEETARGARNRQANITLLKEEISLLEKKFVADLKDGKAQLDLFDGNDEKDKVDKSAQKNASDELKARKEIKLAQLKFEADIQNEIVNDERESYSTRIEASKKFFQLQLAIIKRSHEFENEELDKKVKDEKLTEAQVHEQRLRIQQKYDFEMQNAVKHNSELLIKIRKSSIEKQIAETNKGFEEQMSNLENQRKEELRLLGKRFTDGEITESEFRQKQIEIEERYNEISLKAEIEYYANLINLLRDFGLDVTDAEAKLYDARLKLQQQFNSQREELNKSDAEKSKKYHKDAIKNSKEYEDYIKALPNKLKDARNRLFSELQNTLQALISGGFEREKNRLQDQIDKNEQLKEKEIERINSSADTEERKAARIQIVEARTAAQREQLEQRQRRADQQKANFDRLFALATIGQETAKAVMAQTKFLPASAPLIALILGLGAAQATRVLATPIPRYKYGTEGHPGGNAIVGDGYQHEVATLPDGSTFITPDVPTMMFLPEGTKVSPSIDDYLAKMPVPLPYIREKTSTSTNDSTRMMMKGFGYIVDAIQNKKELHISGTHAGVSSIIKQGNNWLKYVNDQTNF